MAISAEARQDLITLVVGMFDAAPSASILTQFVQDLNNGLTLTEMADNLTNTAEFQSEYKIWSTNEEFAAKFAANLLDGHTSQTEIDFAADFVAGLLNNGASQGEAIVTAVQALEAVDNDDADFGDASAALENKVEVATYYAVEKLADADTLEELRAVVANVDETADSVDSAKEAIDGAIVSGETKVLTLAGDTLEGTTENDLFKSTPTTNDDAVLGNTLSLGDILDGGAGTDTLDAKVFSAYTLGGQTATAVRPETDDIEIVKIEALGEDDSDDHENTGGAEIDGGDEVRLNANDMDNIEQIWSNGSEASLRVENLKTSVNAPNTEDVTIVMKDTGNAGSETERDESDFEVYFHEQHLVAGQAAGQEALSFIMLDQTAYDNGEDPLTGFALDSLTVLLDGVEASMSFADPIADTPSTYQGLVDALNAQLAEIAPELVEEGLTFSVGNTFTDPDGRVGNEVRLSIPDEDESTSRLAFPNPDAPYTSVQFGSSPSNNIYRLAEVVDPEAPSDLPVTATVILDEVGRGSDGGYLRVGSMSDDPSTPGSSSSSNVSDAVSTGIEDFKITVDGNDTSSLSGLYTTNDTLERIYITSAEGSTADLIIGNDHTDEIMGDEVTEEGLTLIDASGFNGDLTLGTSEADQDIVNLATLNAAIDGDVTFHGEVSTDIAFDYNTGAGDDTFVVDVDAESPSSDDFSLDISTSGGADTVTLNQTAGSTSQFADHSDLMNISVDTGSGDDKIMAGGYGSAVLKGGAGNDYVNTDNSGTVGEVFLVNADSSISGVNVPGLSTSADGLGNTTYNMFNTKVQVEFMGVKSEWVTISSTDYQTTASQINDAIKSAIDNNNELKHLLTYADIRNEGLAVSSTIDRAVDHTDFSINFLAPRLADDTNADMQNDIVTDNAAQLTVNDADLEAAWEKYTNSDFGNNSAGFDGGSTATDHDPVLESDGTGDGESSIEDIITALTAAGGAYESTAVRNVNDGVNSTALTQNKVYAGSGDDVLVLSSNTTLAAGNDTVVFEDNFGFDTIINFNTDSTTPGTTARDELDFTSYLDAAAHTRGDSANSNAATVDQRVVYSYDDRTASDLTVSATDNDFGYHNTVTKVDLSQVWAELAATDSDNPDSFEDITAAQVKRALDQANTGVTLTNQNENGMTSVLMLVQDEEIVRDASGNPTTGVTTITSPENALIFTVVTNVSSAGAVTFTVEKKGGFQLAQAFSDLDDLSEGDFVGTAANGTEQTTIDNAIEDAHQPVTVTVDGADGTGGTTGDDLAAGSYNLSDTASNLAAGMLVNSGSVLNNAVNITATDGATVAEADTIDGSTNSGTTTYSVSDSVTNLTTAITGASTALVAVNAAANVTATGTATVADATQILTLTNSGTTTYSVSDTAANLAGAAGEELNSAADVAATDAATVSEATTIAAATNTGTTTYDVTDTLTALLAEANNGDDNGSAGLAGSGTTTATGIGAGNEAVTFTGLTASADATAIDFTDNGVTLTSTEYGLITTNGIDTTAGDAITITTLNGATVAAGSATDTFDFAAADAGVTISGFDSGTDKIDLAGFVAGLTAVAVTNNGTDTGLTGTDAVDGNIYVIDTDAEDLGGASTTATLITDFTNVTQVAAFLNAGGISVTATAEDSMFVINDGDTDNAYIYHYSETAAVTGTDIDPADAGAELVLVATVGLVTGESVVAGDLVLS